MKRSETIWLSIKELFTIPNEFHYGFLFGFSAGMIVAYGIVKWAVSH